MTKIALVAAVALTIASVIVAGCSTSAGADASERLCWLWTGLAGTAAVLFVIGWPAVIAERSPGRIFPPIFPPMDED